MISAPQVMLLVFMVSFSAPGCLQQGLGTAMFRSDSPVVLLLLQQLCSPQAPASPTLFPPAFLNSSPLSSAHSSPLLAPTCTCQVSKAAALPFPQPPSPPLLAPARSARRRPPHRPRPDPRTCLYFGTRHGDATSLHNLRQADRGRMPSIGGQRGGGGGHGV